MNLGIVHSLYNNLYFKDTLSTLCEFVPQVKGGPGGGGAARARAAGACCGV